MTLMMTLLIGPSERQVATTPDFTEPWLRHQPTPLFPGNLYWRAALPFCAGGGVSTPLPRGYTPAPGLASQNTAFPQLQQQNQRCAAHSWSEVQTDKLEEDTLPGFLQDTEEETPSTSKGVSAGASPVI